jgi:hypothetical protein
VVVRHAGVRIFSEKRSPGPQTFEFAGSTVSTETPKEVANRIAVECTQNWLETRLPAQDCQGV